MTRDTFDHFTPPERGRFGDNEHKPARARVTGASDLVDLDLIHFRDAERPKAVLVSLGDRTAAVWLPKSQIEIVTTGPVDYKRRGFVSQPVKVTLPEWLAKDKGLI